MEIAQLIAGRNASEIVTCNAGQPVSEAIAILASKRIGALPVMENGSVAGIFSERDVVYRMADEGTSCLEKLVGQVMTAPAITVEKSTTVLEALALMTRRRIRHLPVTDNGAFVGFLSIGDLVKSRIDEVEHEAQAMRDYIQTA
ncbi:CBS domain-containing protein [Parerythrobacter aestuarii]|uniref:CBS domain-containing protein n=1 Tax=Parerythrobacter aestuarii TaxID=3020909 RepID=UPI0024DE1297|nr:CBS domain-containing protein [Parerythrobacter aestuarii]